VEQSYPKRGHEGQIDKLIKECLSKFENDERYAQDRRYLRLWIKFVTIAS
jgi:checkpoint serine/threonine-protein kinase